MNKGFLCLTDNVLLVNSNIAIVKKITGKEIFKEFTSKNETHKMGRLLSCMSKLIGNRSGVNQIPSANRASRHHNFTKQSCTVYELSKKKSFQLPWYIFKYNSHLYGSTNVYQMLGLHRMFSLYLIRSLIDKSAKSHVIELKKVHGT